MKKTISLLLTIIMLLSITAGLSLSAYAETDNTEITDEYLQYVLDLIPDEMSFDFPEFEFEKAYSELDERIENIFQKNDVKESGFGCYIEVGVLSSSPVVTREDFLTATIILEKWSYREGEENQKSKDVILTFSNSEDYNSAVEGAVKNLKIESPRYYEVDWDFLSHDDVWDNYTQIIEDYYSEQIRDDSITVKAYSGAGGSDGTLNLWTWESGTHIAFFNNGVFYESRRMGHECTVPVITVPKDIADKDVINFVSNKIKSSNENISNINIQKGATIISDVKDNEFDWKKEVTDGYTVKHSFTTNGGFSVDGLESYIIIRQEADVVIPEVDSAIIADGTDETYVIGSGKGASIHCAYPLDEFISVYINGKLVDKANYTLTEGSTILTFKSEYLDTLEAGEYEVTLKFVSGSVSTNLTIEKAADESITTDKNDSATSPSTGAPRGLLVLAAIAFAGGAVMIGKKKEQD